MSSLSRRPPIGGRGKLWAAAAAGTIVVLGGAAWQFNNEMVNQDKLQRLERDAELDRDQRNRNQIIAVQAQSAASVAKGSFNVTLTSQLISNSISFFHPCSGQICKWGTSGNVSTSGNASASGIDILISFDVFGYFDDAGELLMTIRCTMDTQNTTVLNVGKVINTTFNVYPEMSTTLFQQRLGDCWIVQPLKVESYMFPKSNFSVYCCFRVNWQYNEGKLAVTIYSDTLQIDQECNSAQRCMGSFQRLGSVGATSSVYRFSIADSQVHFDAYQMLLLLPNDTFTLFERVVNCPMKMWTSLQPGKHCLIHRKYYSFDTFQVLLIDGKTRHHRFVDSCVVNDSQGGSITTWEQTVDIVNVLVAEHPLCDLSVIILSAAGECNTYYFTKKSDAVVYVGGTMLTISLANQVVL